MAEPDSNWVNYEKTYRQYHPLVRQVLFNICGSQDLDDIVQDVWLKVWRSWKSFEGRSGLKTWIYRISINTAYDYLRRRKPLHLVEDTDMTPGKSNGEGSIVASNLIQKGLSKLSHDHRTVLVLATFEQLPLQEIAMITGSELGTVKSRLHYARKELKHFLSSQGVQL